jgi:putative phosphoribosyl transferase
MRRFRDFTVAGQELAQRLNGVCNSNPTVVVAVVSGGVEVAAEVARQLKLPLELLFIRRLLAPLGPQNVLCATNVAGELVLDDAFSSMQVENGMDHAIAYGIEQLTSRECFCRDGRGSTKLSGKDVVLVDNGIHTGATILTAIRALRRLGVSRIVVAVPVADKNSRSTVEHAADEVVCMEWPEKFVHVGLWYNVLVRPSEEHIRRLFKELHRDEEIMNE